jgi:site-specific recombinase XerD
MVQRDLAAASIPYQDAAARFFDFHSLRCQLATLLDQAGATPRVAQRLMRHSRLAMTDRYTGRPMKDLHAADAAYQGRKARKKGNAR